MIVLSARSKQPFRCSAIFHRSSRKLDRSTSLTVHLTTPTSQRPVFEAERLIDQDCGDERRLRRAMRGNEAQQSTEAIATRKEMDGLNLIAEGLRGDCEVAGSSID